MRSWQGWPGQGLGSNLLFHSQAPELSDGPQMALLSPPHLEAMVMSRFVPGDSGHDSLACSVDRDLAVLWGMGRWRDQRAGPH